MKVIAALPHWWMCGYFILLDPIDHGNPFYMQPLVFHYTDPHSFLVDNFKSRQQKNPQFSLRAFAKQMGFKCHSSLVLLYQGKRPIRIDHLEKLLKGLKLPENDSDYFRALVEYQEAKTPEQKKFHQERLQLLHPAREMSVMETERFRLIADWLHMTLLEMTKLEGFNPSPVWIKNRLFFDVTEKQIQDSLDRLIQLGLLKIENERLIKTNERLTTPKDFASECVREHHRQVLGNALIALDEQAIDERFFNSCTMTVATGNYESAKNLIRQFREDMAKLMEKDQGDETYQLSVSFFKMTQKKQGMPC